MATCPHCLNRIADSRTAYDTLEASADVSPCPCIEAAYGHRPCTEMDDHPPCPEPACERCAECCRCQCSVCDEELHAMEVCACDVA